MVDFAALRARTHRIVHSMLSSPGTYTRKLGGATFTITIRIRRELSADAEDDLATLIAKEDAILIDPLELTDSLPPARGDTVMLSFDSSVFEIKTCDPALAGFIKCQVDAVS